MPYATIGKRPGAGPTPSLADYAHARDEFDWNDAARLLAGFDGGRLNIAHEAVDRHLDTNMTNRTAIRFLGRPAGQEGCAMLAHGIRRLPIVERDGSLAGILTVDDILGLVTDPLTDVIRLISNQRLREQRLRR